MAWAKGNKLWQLRSKDGKEPKYKPDELWKRAIEYFQWIGANPLKEEQLFAYQGKVTRETISKMRAMTYEGLQLFLDISQKTWDNYSKKDDYILITNAIKKIIYEQKFTGAAATLLNPNIIARDLGLRDNKDITSDGEQISLDVNFVKREKKAD